MKAIVIKNPLERMKGEYGVYTPERKCLGIARPTVRNSVAWYIATNQGLVGGGYEQFMEEAICKIASWHGLEVEL